MGSLGDSLFVNVIESPSQLDLDQGRSEGKMLTEALELIGLPYEYSLVRNYPEFMDALGRKTVLGVENHGRIPAIHLSMHGSHEGVQLTGEKFLPWADLNWKLRLINSKLNHTLVVASRHATG